MKIPSGVVGIDPSFQRRGFAESRARDARIEDAQYETLPARPGAAARVERREPSAAVEALQRPASPAVGTYLYVQRNSDGDGLDAEIAGIDVYV